MANNTYGGYQMRSIAGYDPNIRVPTAKTYTGIQNRYDPLLADFSSKYGPIGGLSGLLTQKTGTIGSPRYRQYMGEAAGQYGASRDAAMNLAKQAGISRNVRGMGVRSGINPAAQAGLGFGRDLAGMRRNDMDSAIAYDTKWQNALNAGNASIANLWTNMLSGATGVDQFNQQGQQAINDFNWNVLNQMPQRQREAQQYAQQQQQYEEQRARQMEYEQRMRQAFSPGANLAGGLTVGMPGTLNPLKSMGLMQSFGYKPFGR